MSLSRDELLAPRAAVRERIHLPSFGGEVGIRMLSGAERRDFFLEGAALDKKKDGDAWRTYPERLLVRALCGEDGACLFTLADTALVAALPGVDLDMAFEAACKVNRLAHHGVEAVAGKSEGTPNAVRSSVSVLLSESPTLTDS